MAGTSELTEERATATDMKGANCGQKREPLESRGKLGDR